VVEAVVVLVVLLLQSANFRSLAVSVLARRKR
jgi:hypothetical protein